MSRIFWLQALTQAIQAVEGGSFRAFGESGIVEDGVDEIGDLAFEGENRLADVEEFGGVLAKNVNAEQFESFAVKEELEAAFGMACDLATGDFAVVGNANLVGHISFGELLFGFPDEGNLRNGVNPVRVGSRIGVQVETEGAGGGDAALLHGD